MPDPRVQQPLKNKIQKRLLVVKMRALGDTVLLTGTIRVLQNRYPDWLIDVAVAPGNVPLLENLPFIHEVIAVDEPHQAMGRLAFWMRLGWKLRQVKYDAVLVFHATGKTAFFGRFVAGRRGLCVVNHHGLGRPNRYSQRAVPGRGEVKANIDRDLDILRAMGERVDLQEAMPELRITPAESQQARSLLHSAGNDGPLIFLGVGASRDTKRWPPENMIQAMGLLLQKRPTTRFVFCTIASDEPWLSAFQQILRNNNESISEDQIIRFKDLPLRNVMAILSRCHVYLGNDSGLKHVAVGLGLPTLTMFGPENPLEWHPYSRERHPILFLEDMACRTATGQHWCSIPVCVAEGHRCMKNLSASEAAREVSRLLEDAEKQTRRL